jgi:hypothetical protein
MFAKLAIPGLVLFLTVAAFGQQPNTGTHSMTINGVDGAPFPILTTVKTSVIANFGFQTSSFQPYAVFQGNLAAGSAFFVGGFVDLSLSPMPVLVIDGWANPAFRTDLAGQGGFGVLVPNSGTPPNGVPIGLQLGLQAVCGDPFNSPYGMSLTAATRITVVQGPTVAYYNLGDEGSAPVSFTTVPIPFYGNTYTQAYLYGNGYITFGTSESSNFTPTPSAFTGGLPRIAPFWGDLECPNNTVKSTLDANPGGGNFGYLKIEYINVHDWGLGVIHNFSVLMRADGYIEIIEAQNNNPSIYPLMVGMAPGGGLGGPQSPKNFFGILTAAPPNNVYVAATNESFYESFDVSIIFDLPGFTMHFQPNAPGSGAATTAKYLLY